MIELFRATEPNTATVRAVSGTVENRVTDPAQRPYSIVGQGVYGRVQQGGTTTDAIGSVIAVSGVADVIGSGHPDNEYAALFGVVRMGTTARPATGRVWVADTGAHGPIGQQADLLTGNTCFLNNYHDSSPKAGASVGFSAVTKRGAGPAAKGAGHDLADTYPLDYGFAVAGTSRAAGVAGVGWRVGYRAGGAASGWMNRAETSLLGKGAEFTDYTEAGIHIHSPATDGAPAAVFEGAVIVQGRDLLAEVEALKRELAELKALLRTV